MANELTAAEITAILANNRNRGGLDTFLTDFEKSDEMYRVLNEQPQFAAKTKDQLVSIKNQLTMKAKKAEMTNVRLVKNGELILIVNTDKLVSAEDSE
jgi:hypothetical protein